MKTLIIHPKDETTDFLKRIYSNEKDYTLITKKPKTEKELTELILAHDRIMMMGHGFPSGLYSTPDRALIIRDEHAPLLKDKDCVFIWCNADRYVKKHNLKGFYTGMIISEVAEADYCEVFTSQSEVDESNYLFAETIGRYINYIDGRRDCIVSEYNSSTNPVIIYNQERIYSNVD